MDKTVTSSNTYTAIELAELRLPGFPTSRKNWYELVAREQWDVVEKPGKGPGGVRREYIPPPEVQLMIDAVLRGETPPVRERRKQGGARVERVPLHPNDESLPGTRPLVLNSPPINAYVSTRARMGLDYPLLKRCLAACATVYGADYGSLPIDVRLEFAADYYNALVSMAVNMKGGVDAFERLDAQGLAEQLRLLLQMGVVRRWPETGES